MRKVIFALIILCSQSVWAVPSLDGIQGGSATSPTISLDLISGGGLDILGSGTVDNQFQVDVFLTNDGSVEVAGFDITVNFQSSDFGLGAITFLGATSAGFFDPDTIPVDVGTLTVGEGVSYAEITGALNGPINSGLLFSLFFSSNSIGDIDFSIDTVDPMSLSPSIILSDSVGLSIDNPVNTNETGVNPATFSIGAGALPGVPRPVPTFGSMAIILTSLLLGLIALARLPKHNLSLVHFKK